MYLKRITVTGFKSFANKTVLDLETGISAIVGPNGSGKSNLADAIRWALGEQSKGRLRLGDREEVVFAGTERRAKASYAEVVLLFNNDDGAFPVDLTEVEISRRLYRSGETDYRLGGRSVRLGDIQALLAEAGFGAGTYAVIGQGMIDSFLMSSPAERKLLFDEAAGIRASEIKRESSLRKLAATATNLVRLRDIVGELEPRLANLKRGAAAAAERERLEGELSDLRSRYATAAATELETRRTAQLHRRDDAKLALHRLRHEVTELEKTQRARLQQAGAFESQQTKLRAEHEKLEEEREAVSLRLGDLRGRGLQLEHQAREVGELARQLRRAEKELDSARIRATELADELRDNHAAAQRAANAIKSAADEVTSAQAMLVALRQETADGTQQQYVSHALEVMKAVARQLGSKDVSMDEIRLLVHKAGRLLSHAASHGETELIPKLRNAQIQLEAAMTRRETATEHQTNVTITGHSLEIDASHQAETVSRLTIEVAQLRQQHRAADMAADEIREVTRLTKSDETRLVKLKEAINLIRSQIAAQSESTGAAAVAEEAARLERLRADQVAAQLEVERATAALAELTSATHQLAERIVAWGVVPAAGEVRLDAAVAEQTMMTLEAQVSARLAVDAANAGEYREVSERHNELVTQIADLETAETDLHAVVRELDEVIRRRFKENFAQLSQYFTSYFERLFGGGQAALELIEDESGEYGINIKASPKGKRLASLAALSGGERALAGVALLAAILRVNPSPFVVLDEIDAALDEANSGRLAEIMSELQAHSQLIVITHNRQTMTVAKVLFGVTMNDHHVSHLLSLRLEEATQLAAR